MKIDHENCRYEFLYREFIDYVERTPRSKRSIDLGITQEKGDPNFHGTRSLDEALDLARYGWDAGIEQLAPKGGILVSGGTSFIPNVHGSLPNIENYIMGSPEAMLEAVCESEYNRPTATILFGLGYTARWSTKDALRYAKGALGYINKVQETHNVEIIGLTESKGRLYPGGGITTVVKIKDLSERFTLNNLAFAFHPSFFRRLAFKLYETTEYIMEEYGYTCEEGDFQRLCETMRTEGEKLHILPRMQDHGPELDEDKIIIK